MELSFNIDFDEGALYILMDNHKSMPVYREEDGSFDYSGLNRLKDEAIREKLKSMARMMFSLEDL